eukprot:CAMPEP_0203792726 /NCGR_PEP_ID=MMETSP0100_2-20121128/5426_1 /ASSEMBLY_ACC=CAM_ASM_000210 /TAXON_ID=96639 /ORGANISM=" , Strain NY0313808BC1" /LENGTH=419 /DNA_ID=CAMNT_0050696339 /DNA_START=76 /DNA_END=1333 /DNA_ORIENTATION=+
MGGVIDDSLLDCTDILASIQDLLPDGELRQDTAGDKDLSERDSLCEDEEYDIISETQRASMDRDVYRKRVLSGSVSETGFGGGDPEEEMECRMDLQRSFSEGHPPRTKTSHSPDQGEFDRLHKINQQKGKVYDKFGLKVVYQVGKTGFEETKELKVFRGMTLDEGRYSLKSKIDEGVFATAIEAKDTETGEHVCLKCIRNSKDFFDQALDEIKILNKIHENDPDDNHYIVKWHAEPFYEREHLFLPFEKLGPNLLQILQTEGDQYFSDTAIRMVMYQLFVALDFIHTKLGIIHCDIKPENILISDYDSCRIKLIDFGSSSFAGGPVFTYIQSRFYRAPEVILGLRNGFEIDIWSAGCILAELYTQQIIFEGPTATDCVGKMMDKGYLQSFLKQTSLNENAVLILSSLLEIDPDRRLTAA